MYQLRQQVDTCVSKYKQAIACGVAFLAVISYAGWAKLDTVHKAIEQLVHDKVDKRVGGKLTKYDEKFAAAEAQVSADVKKLNEL